MSKFIIENTTIYLAKTVNKNIGILIELLSKSEKQRFLRYKNEQSAKEFLVGRFMIRKIVSSITNVAPKSIIIKINNNNRPKLFYPKINNFDFNISHSAGTIALAVSDRAIGIDIEKIKPIDIMLFKDIFTEEEKIYIYRSNNNLKNFYKIWTLKEAFLKAKGIGLSNNIKNFQFIIKENMINILNKNSKQKYYFVNYMINNYCLSLCSKKNIGKVIIKKFKI